MPPKKNASVYGNNLLTADGEQIQENAAIKKKSAPKNAFYFYIQDFREAQKTRGIIYKSYEEVVDAAADSWQQLSAEEHKSYQDAVKESKIKDKSNLQNEFATDGKRYAIVHKEEQKRKDHLEKMLNEILGTIRSQCTPDALINYSFHLIHVNYYCRTIAGHYVPCELAISEFSLMNGVKRLFHILVNPGELPLGYTYESKKHSEETHNIPMPEELKFDGAICDYAQIFQCLLSFLKRDAKTEYKLPPLYTIVSQLEPCENILENLCKYENEELNIFRVYPAKYMFFELQHACVDVFKPTDINIVKLPFISLAEQELEKDTFNYTKGISCNFHEKTDAIPHCSLSCVQRWSFTILECCHRITKMSLMPGKHVPEHINVSQLKKLRASVQRSKSNDRQKQNTTMHSKSINSSGNMTHLDVQLEAMNLRHYSRRQAVPSISRLRAPKDISMASKLLFSDENEFSTLGS